MKAPSFWNLQGLSRREFLECASQSLLALMLLPELKGLEPLTRAQNPDEAVPLQGRVISNYTTIHRQPDSASEKIETCKRDQVLDISGATVGAKTPEYNRVWYRVEPHGYVHSGGVQPVETRLNPVRSRLPRTGRLAEVTVPFTNAVWNYRTPYEVAYRLYYQTTYWVVDARVDQHGVVWYLIPDDKFGIRYYVKGEHLRLLREEDVSPLSAHVPLEEKRIEINLEQQTVIAYEAGQPVFMTRAATGAKFRTGSYATPYGTFITNRKRPSRHMTDGDGVANGSYDLPGVPWVSYLTTSGISFHGTYWHNDFGRPRSHGCINVSSDAARWIYRWTLPAVPLYKDYFAETYGTRVDVI